MSVILADKTSRAQYHKLTLSDEYSDAKTELLEGEVIRLAPPEPKHSTIVEQAADLFRLVVGNKHSVRQEQPLVISEYSEPQPDITVCSAGRGAYMDRHPGPEDVLLVAEVSDSSRTKDHLAKMSLHAFAGIRTYWIIDLVRDQIEVFSQPLGKRYREHVSYKPGERVPFPLPEGVSILVSELLFK